MESNNAPTGGDSLLVAAGGFFLMLFVMFIIVLIKVSSKKKAASGTSSSDETADYPTTDVVSSSSDGAPSTLRSKQVESGVASEDNPSSKSGKTIIQQLLESLKDPVVWGSFIADQALSKVAEKIETKIRSRSDKIGRNVLNKAANSSDKFVQRSGTKLVAKAGERTAIKTSVKDGQRLAAAGTKMAAQAAIAGEAGPAAPFVEAAELAFNMFSGAIDGLNLGGFKDLTTMSALNDTRDEFNKYYSDGMKSEGYDLPIIYGPMDKMEQDAYDEAITTKLISLILADSNRPRNPLENDEYTNQKLDEAFSSLCLAKAGVITKHPKTGELACGFSQKDCKAPWPQETGDTYYEFKNGVCQATQSEMRNLCEGMGMDVTYNTTTGSCNLSEKYCGRYGGISKLKNGDCEMSQGQQIAEAIFGTTITRSILNIFDFKDNYKPCPAGYVDSGERIGNINLLANFLCEKNECSADQEQMGGLCYPKCRSGYSSKWGGAGSDVAGMCYKDCGPGYDKTAAFCTWLEPSSIPCPSDYPVAQGGMCYKSNVRRLAGGAIATTIPASKSSCPSGQRDDGTSCWEDYKVKTDSCAYTIKGCKKWDYLTDASLVKDWCSQWGDVCQAGLKGSGCGCIKKTVFDRYKCPDGYSPTTSGLCQADAKPAKLSYIRDSYTRNPAGISLQVKAKERKTNFPSTSETQFKESTIGKYIQGGINSVRNGDVKGLGKALGGLALTTNPGVLSMGMSDVVDIGYQKATNS